MLVLLAFTLAKVAVPPVLHCPMPNMGAVAETVALLLHTVWLFPAKAVLGLLFSIVTSSSVKSQALVIVQRKVSEPGSIVTFVALLLVFAITGFVAVPPIIVQLPVPFVAVLAAMVKLLLQSVWFVPA